MNMSLCAALLCAALGLVLGASRARWNGILAFGIALLATSVIRTTASIGDVELGCLSSTIANAASAYARGSRVRIVLAANTGLWLGMSAARDRTAPLAGIAALALAFGLARVLFNRLPLAIHVLSSWLIAVAALALALHFVPVTPGYVPDHLE